MAKEIELKLTIAPGHIKEIEQLPTLNALSIAAPSKQKLYSVYYDTPDLLLRKQHCSLRIRRIGKKWIQTIKSGGKIAAGLHQHDESEIVIKKAQPDFNHLQQTGVISPTQQLAVVATLKPIFITQFTRYTRLLQTKDGSIIEFCLDHGKITSNHLTDPIHEIELELKSGSPARLFELAWEIAQLANFPIRLENANKAERGYKLFTGTSTPPNKATSIEINPKTTLISTFGKVLSSCLIQITKNENGVLSGRNSEYLHQMRVGIRRLRSAFTIFKPLFPTQQPSITYFEHELKWLMQELNPARNWYVFAYEILPLIIANHPDSESIVTIQKLSQKQLNQYTQHIQTHLQSKRYLEFILKLNLWIEDLHHSTDYESKLSIESFSRSYLSNQHSALTKFKEKLRKLKPDDLHALRIRIKKQHYVTEFFYSLYSKQALFEQYLHLLSALQSALGSINDYSMINTLLESTLSSHKQKKFAQTIGIIQGWSAHGILQSKVELKNLLKDFCDSSPFTGDE